ncbi:MAG: archease [Gammaproteobacteria bacterium]|nr:archease [Gammaproteobacteria bacterium]NIR84064.1 archease [Gammaproteobacteria bacterium]NIR89208.1 archease [Gammaproteobacteria bacterium]NIU05010.1 archease [Gammaproteobacteria bacterium]NIV52176.1 archease [Gammaproteobacteria bacterium]
MPYEFLDDEAIADVAFQAWGGELGEVFACAADATMNVMIEDLDAIRASESRDISLENETADMLLFDLLQELVYYKDAEQLLLRVSDVDIRETNGVYRLHARAWGERLDPTRHEQVADVKAVTLHRFELEQTAEGWAAHVILDI